MCQVAELSKQSTKTVKDGKKEEEVKYFFPFFLVHNNYLFSQVFISFHTLHLKEINRSGLHKKKGGQ